MIPSGAGGCIHRCYVGLYKAHILSMYIIVGTWIVYYIMMTFWLLFGLALDSHWTELGQPLQRISLGSSRRRYSHGVPRLRYSLEQTPLDRSSLSPELLTIFIRKIHGVYYIITSIKTPRTRHHSLSTLRVRCLRRMRAARLALISKANSPPICTVA